MSLGVQSLDDDALKFLGRNHTAAEALRAVEVAQRLFPRVSLDLIYARPDQTTQAWAEELRATARLGVEHISPYQLTIEAGTPFDRQVRRHTLVPPDEDLAAALYETTQAVLEAEGFGAYEVSNHARGEAARSVHNLAYWRGWDYVGVGPGAHGRLSINGKRQATQAAAKVADYIAGVGFTSEGLTPREAAIERLLLGLRSVEGCRSATWPRCLPSTAAKAQVALRDEGLLRINGGSPGRHHGLEAAPCSTALTAELAG